MSLTTTTLSFAANSYTTTLQLASTAKVYVGSFTSEVTYLFCEQEFMKVNLLPQSGIVTVLRGQRGTSSASHASGTVVTVGLASDFLPFPESGPTPQTVSSGTVALGVAEILSGAAAATVTVSAPGTLTTDDIIADFNADPSGVTGYAPSANGMLTIIKFPTANNVNFIVLNNTVSAVTPGAITLNWRVIR